MAQRGITIDRKIALTARDELQKLLWDTSGEGLYGTRYDALLEALNVLEEKLGLPLTVEPSRTPIGFVTNI